MQIKNTQQKKKENKKTRKEKYIYKNTIMVRKLSTILFVFE